MTVDVLIAHALLAVLLFFLVNWLGRHSISSGYIQLSPFAKADEAPAFNFIFRLLAPTVFIVLVAAFWYALGLDLLIHQIWLVAVFYVIGRWAFNIVVGRGRLLNWPEQMAMAILVIGLAYVVYDRFIVVRRNLLPDPANVTNELWLVILVFLYQVANGVTLTRSGTTRRKRNYLKRMYESANRRFGHTIDSTTSDLQLRMFIYAVLIYENFNRPQLYRWIEHKILSPFGWASSTGIMQVQSKEPLSDEESVRLGAKHLMNLYETSLQGLLDESLQLLKSGDVPGLPSQPLDSAKAMPAYLLERAMLAAAAKYNIRSDYGSEVYRVYAELLQTYHPELSDRSYRESLGSENRDSATGNEQ